MLKNKLIMVLLLFVFVSNGYAAQQVLQNLETLGQIRTKINQNFTELYGWGDHGDAGYLDQTAGDARYSLLAHNHAGVYEPVLGNPLTDGLCLTSTAAGTRSWASCGTGTGGAVDSVNGATGVVVLDIDDFASTGAAAYLGATQGTIGHVVTWVDDGDGNAALTIDAAASPIADAGNYFTTDTIEEALQEIGAGGFGGASAIADLSDWPAAVSATEVGYLDGVTSGIQAQINAISVGAPVVAVPQYSDSTCTTGTYAVDASHFYICRTTDTWDRIALLGWSAPTPDTTPNEFTFVDQVDVELDTEITSALVQITGINTATPVTATGGTAAICTSDDVLDCGTFGASPGNVENNQYVAARHTSSAANSTPVMTTVDVGGVEGTFTSTTLAEIATFSCTGTELICENFEGTGTPTGWVTNSRYNYDYAVSPIADTQSLSTNFSGTGQMASWTDTETIRVEFSVRFDTIPDGSLVAFFDLRSGATEVVKFYFSGVSNANNTIGFRAQFAGGGYLYSNGEEAYGLDDTIDYRVEYAASPAGVGTASLSLWTKRSTSSEWVPSSTNGGTITAVDTLTVNNIQSRGLTTTVGILDNFKIYEVLP